MNFDEIIYFLEKRLKGTKPGAFAHNQMKPTLANGSPISIKHTSPPKKGAVLILINNINGEACFPLIQRPTYEGVHSGQIALPGGKYEPSDDDLFQTALRETEEEIGIAQQEIEVIGALSQFYVAASNYDVLPVVGRMNAAPSFRLDQREVEEVINPKLAALTNRANRKKKELLVRGNVKLDSPYFDLEGKVVWGATAMMLSEFEAILGEFRST